MTRQTATNGRVALRRNELPLTLSPMRKSALALSLALLGLGCHGGAPGAPADVVTGERAVDRGGVGAPSRTPTASTDPAPTTPATTMPLGGTLTILSAELSGELGGIGGFSGPVETFALEERSTARERIRLDSSAPDAWAITALTLGGSSLAALPIGTSARYEGGVELSVRGCSGPARDAWTFDDMARTIDVQVDDGGNGTRVFRFNAVFAPASASTATQTVRGEIHYALADGV